MLLKYADYIFTEVTHIEIDFDNIEDGYIGITFEEKNNEQMSCGIPIEHLSTGIIIKEVEDEEPKWL